MDREPIFLLGFAALAAGAAGCAWLAQISGYPLWRFVSGDALGPYVKLWQAAAFPFLVLPAFLALLFAVGLLWLRGVPMQWALPVAGVCVAVWAVSWFAGAGAGFTSGSASGFAAGRVTSSAAGFAAEWGWVRTLLWTGLAAGVGVELCRSTVRLNPQQGGAAVLLAVTTMAGVVGAAQVWMVQVLCYRLWPLVGRENFYDYHVAWWHSIWSSIFIPAGVALVGCVLLLRWHPAGTRWLWVGFGLQMLLGASTGAWWGPLMGRLATRAEGLLADRYALLMTTHWVRVGIVTAYALVMLAALGERLMVGAGL